MNTTTLIVQFGEDSGLSEDSAYLSAEVDSREDGLNEGKTQFYGGDSVSILIYRSLNVKSLTADSSAGTVSIGGTVNVEQEQEVVFVESNTATLPVPAIGGITVKWIGRSLGSLTLQPDQVTVVAGSTGLAVAKVQYVAKADIAVLASPTNIEDVDSYTIVVLITGGL